MIFRKPNFQGDYFVHAIDIVDKTGKLVDHIGGINNVVVANVAFEELRHYHSRNSVLILRDGARVMRRSRGFDRDRERLMESRTRDSDTWAKDDDEGLWPV
ncbi:hypothetical protein ACCT07_03080 [Rhizobium johnstonii]|uniref:hypothetical protein n=1 Tax=Rhizobium johnstonii TaxID=3019933 RepID=UPI003F9C9416